MSLNENENTVKVTAFKSFKDLIENKESSEIVKSLVAGKEDVLFFSNKDNKMSVVGIIGLNTVDVDTSVLKFPEPQEIKDRIINKRDEENNLKNNNKFGL